MPDTELTAIVAEARRIANDQTMSIDERKSMLRTFAASSMRLTGAHSHRILGYLEQLDNEAQGSLLESQAAHQTGTMGQDTHGPPGTPLASGNAS